MQCSERPSQTVMSELHDEFVLALDAHLDPALSELRSAMKFAVADTLGQLDQHTTEAAALVEALIQELAEEVAIHADPDDARSLTEHLYRILQARLTTPAAAA